MSRLHVFSITLAFVFAAPFAPAPIVWESSYESAVARARDESRVLMVAVHLVDEIASKRMIDKVYTDDRIRELCARTVALAASNAHIVDRPDFLEHFGGHTLEEARAIDIAVRERVLAPDAEGYVIAPQHVFLAPAGEVLLSVPYEITAAELDWCLIESLRRIDPESKLEHSSRARAPRRLVEGGVVDTSQAPPPIAPPSGAELDELIEQMLDSRLEGAVRATAARSVARSNEKRALRAVERILREVRDRRAGRGLGLEALLRAIGEVSPPEYHEMVADQLGSNALGVRGEAAVALEQIAAAAAEAAISKAIGRESEPRVRKDLARALGACGYESAKARRELLRIANKDDDPLVRVNAVLGLGRLTPHNDVRAFLATCATDGNDRLRAAALVAMVWSRDSYWRELLPALIKGESIDAERAAPLDETRLAALVAALAQREARTEAAFVAAQSVLAGGSLDVLAEVVRDVGGDTIVRRRLFDTVPAGE